MTKAYAVYYCQGLDANGEPDIMLETVWATKEKAQAYIDSGEEHEEECSVHCPRAECAARAGRKRPPCG